MPKRFAQLAASELRELHLALALRIAELDSTDTRKMGPSAKARVRADVSICKDLDKPSSRRVASE